jgi:acyl-CoA dehydrogenase
MWDFMQHYVLPAELVWAAPPRRARPAHPSPSLEDLKAEARRRGLWNLFHPELSGLTNVEYAAIAEISGWSPVIAPEAINCQAPDTGNIETLHLFATAEQRERWLSPLLDGTIRSAFAMTEPAVASSDATNIETSIAREGDEYVINGHKWFITGVADERCKIFIVMGKTDPGAEPHRQQSMVLVERDTTLGVSIERHSHCSATRTSTATPRFASPTFGSQWRTCSRRRATGSSSHRPDSVPVACTMRCAR